jgi:hypothetical protein
MLQFRKQPPLLQSGGRFRRPQRLAQDQGFGFVHLPNRRVHRIASQLAQGGNALVAVNYPVVLRLISDGNHHDRYLLSRRGQRSQQLSFTLGAAHPQVFERKIQLVQLKLHGDCPRSVS